MGTFNERAETFMSTLSEAADKKEEVKMLHLVNCVTLGVIAKVLCQVGLTSFFRLDQDFEPVVVPLLILRLLLVWI